MVILSWLTHVTRRMGVPFADVSEVSDGGAFDLHDRAVDAHATAALTAQTASARNVERGTVAVGCVIPQSTKESDPVSMPAWTRCGDRTGRDLFRTIRYTYAGGMFAKAVPQCTALRSSRSRIRSEIGQ